MLGAFAQLYFALRCLSLAEFKFERVLTLYQLLTYKYVRDKKKLRRTLLLSL